LLKASVLQNALGGERGIYTHRDIWFSGTKTELETPLAASPDSFWNHSLTRICCPFFESLAVAIRELFESGEECRNTLINQGLGEYLALRVQRDGSRHVKQNEGLATWRDAKFAQVVWGKGG
jgi:hypothetical protein